MSATTNAKGRKQHVAAEKQTVAVL